MNETSAVEIPGSLQPQESDRSVLLAAKGGSIVFIGSVFGYASQFVLGIILTRLMGAELYGQYKVALIAGEIAAAIALLGLDYAMVRFVALFDSKHDQAGLWGTLQVGVVIAGLSSLIVGLGLFLLANPLAVYVFHEPNLVPILRWASLIVPFSAMMSILASSTRGFNKMQYNVGAKQFAQPLTRLILLIPLAFIGLTAVRAVNVYVAGMVVACILLVYFLNHLFPLRRPIRSARRDIKGIIRFSLPAYASTLISTFGPSLQTVLLGSLNTMATVGIFAVANQVSTASTLFNASIGTASDPIISGLHGQQDPKRLSHFYKTTAKWMFTVNLPMFLTVLLLAKPILTIFGQEFVAGVSALNVLALANLVMAAAGVSDGVLAMTGNTPVKLLNSAVQSALSIGLCFLFIPRYGALGAALAVLTVFIVIHLLLVTEMFILFRMLPYSIGFLKPIVAGIAAFAVGWLCNTFFHTGTSLLLAILIAGIIFGVYAIMILVLGLSEEDRAIFVQLRGRMTNRFSRR